MIAYVNNIEYPATVLNGDTYVIEKSSNVCWKKLYKNVTATKVDGIWHFDFAQEIPFKIEDNHIIFNLPVNDIPVKFELDTGSYTTVVAESLAMKWNLTEGTTVQSFGINSTFTSYKTSFNTEIQGNQMLVPTIVEIGSNDLMYPLLGDDFFIFNHLDFSIDYKNQIISIWKELNYS